MSVKIFEIPEDELEYKKLMEEALDSSLTGILVANKYGDYIYANKKYEAITGFCENVMRHVTCRTMGETMIREKLSAVELVLEKKKEIIVEQSLVHSDQSLLVKGVPYFGASGEIEYVICHLLDITAISRFIENADKIKHENDALFEDALKTSIYKDYSDEKIIYKSKAIFNVIEQINKVAKTDATVFIRGESGTGKELFAKHLHNESDRKNKSFIRINCSAIPETLFESELFGYESGTFSGGNAKGKKGLLEYANHGTMLLDEIGSMPFSIQSKLLRVLQEKEFTKLGGHEPIKIDIRFVAATNSDIEQMVKDKTFREDLYYRLNIIPICIPALRERKEDIPLLIYQFVEKCNKKYKLNKTIDSDVVDGMMNMPFPGNVRQLKNFIERMLLLSQNEKLTKEDFVHLYFEEPTKSSYDMSFEFGQKSLEELVDDYEKYILTEYKKKYKSSYKVAEQLKMSQSAIFRKLQRYNINE